MAETTDLSTIPIPIERCDLGMPAVLIVNHPDVGLVALADPSVPADHLDTLAQIVDRRRDLYPERVPEAPRCPIEAARLRVRRRAVAEHAAARSRELRTG